MSLIYRDKRWYSEVPLPERVKYAADTPRGDLLTVYDDGRVMVGGIQISNPDSPALNDYTRDFKGYPIPHSGEGPPVVESNGYVTAAWMGAIPDPDHGTPIWIGVYRDDRPAVRYLLHFAGTVMADTIQRGIDNHCVPQLFIRESDKRVVYLSGGHHTTLYAGVSHSPHAGYGFHRLHPVGPESDRPEHGHTYPAARMVGDTLHVVSRFTTDGYQFHLVHWTVDTLTMATGPMTVLDKVDAEHSYAVWYQQPRIEGDKLIVDTNRIYTPKGEEPGTYTDPEPNRFEIQL